MCAPASSLELAGDLEACYLSGRRIQFRWSLWGSLVAMLAFIGGLIFADGMPATGIILVCFVLQLGIFIQQYRRMEKLKKSRSNLL